MKTVGVYVFTDQVKERRVLKKDGYFDGNSYAGLNYILSEIDMSKYKITYISKDSLDNVDYALVSITSYFDVINLIGELYGKKHSCKIIAGGAGLSNIAILRDIIDYAVIGRGECIINDLLSDNTPEGVWSKDENYNFNTKISVLPLKKYLNIDNPVLGKCVEKSVGCPKKCYFCEYSWKNKHSCVSPEYESGIADRESLFSDIKWKEYKRNFVSAVDGINETVRKIINKPLSDADIANKINQIYDSKKEYLCIKLYCLLGYPFETGFNPEQLCNALTASAKKGETRLNIFINSPHFMPMPFTPMENEPLNRINFREKIIEYDFSKYKKDNIKIYWSEQSSNSPVSAHEAAIVYRGNPEDTKKIYNIICSKKYKSLRSSQKLSVLYQHFGYLLGEYENVLPYIERSYNVSAAKNRYKRLKQEYMQEEAPA